MNKLIATAGIAAALASTVAFAAPASAATNPYTPTGVCGSSYHEIDHHAISGATVYLMYNGSWNCVVTIKTADVGTKTDIAAMLETQTNPPGSYDDQGKYAYYASGAGPAKGHCVKWGGMSRDDIWETGWEHCGS